MEDHSHAERIKQDADSDEDFKELRIRYPTKPDLNAIWLLDFLEQILCQTQLLDFDPCSLLICHENVAHFCLLFNFCEIVNDDTDEKIDDE